MPKNKPIIVFTNFNDAINIIREKSFVAKINNKLIRLDLKVTKFMHNYDIYAISFAIPEEYKEITHANCLLPTVKIIRQLQIDKDFKAFRNSYREVLLNRKRQIQNFFDHTNRDIYFVTCLEDISNGEFCHRTYLYEILRDDILKDEVEYITRDGTTSSSICNINLVDELSMELDEEIWNVNFEVSSDIRVNSITGMTGVTGVTGAIGDNRITSIPRIVNLQESFYNRNPILFDRTALLDEVARHEEVASAETILHDFLSDFNENIDEESENNGEASNESSDNFWVQ